MQKVSVLITSFLLIVLLLGPSLAKASDSIETGVNQQVSPETTRTLTDIFIKRYKIRKGVELRFYYISVKDGWAYLFSGIFFYEDPYIKNGKIMDQGGWQESNVSAAALFRKNKSKRWIILEFATFEPGQEEKFVEKVKKIHATEKIPDGVLPQTFPWPP